jgi:uncharacterized cupin superfamily protein
MDEESEDTMPRPALAIEADRRCGYPQPFRDRVGPWCRRELGDAFGLTTLGVSHEVLQPGSRSSVGHWHTRNDEFVWVLEGELVLHLGGREHLLHAGDCVGFKAGRPSAHHLENRSMRPAVYLAAGSRMEDDVAHYPDDDLVLEYHDAGRSWRHKDGTRYLDGF